METFEGLNCDLEDAVEVVREITERLVILFEWNGFLRGMIL